jgi:ABC-type multidrug transport system ATPase subunit
MNRPIDSISRLGEQQSLVLGSSRLSDVVLVSSDISPRHARITRRTSGLVVQDLDTEGGTFVNGQEVRGQVALRPGDRLRIGSLEILIPGQAPPTRAAQAAPPGPDGPSSALTVGVVRVVKRVKAKSERGVCTRAILDDVSFHLEAGQFLGILGASGSGKSTLIKILAGLVELSDGAILLNGQSVDQQALRSDRRIAYLPQDVVIHEALTPLVALAYIAKLKGLGGNDEERHGLVRDALKRVDLLEHGGTPIHRLSGGQRKRAALAAELLGDPKLILLDEATSGLDPATEAEMMDLFRSLAREGRTVICITHFPGRLHLCDRLLYLIRGKCVFDGTPQELMEFFGVESIEDVYTKQAERSPEEWESAFHRTVVGLKASQRVPPSPVGGGRSLPIPEPITRDQWLRQARDLTARYFRLQRADVKNLLLLFVQAPAIALMLALTFGGIRSSFAEQHASDTKQVLFVLVVSVLWCSGTASVREIVKELPVLQHEARFGVGLGPFLLSKFTLLGLISLTQTLVLLGTVRHFTELTSQFDLQFLVLAFTGLVGVALGLLVSATAGTSERAMTLLPVLLIAQAIFSGGLARLTGGIKVLAMVAVPAYWSLDGLKSQFSSDLLNATYPGAPGHYQPPILGAGGPLVLDLLALGLQAAALMTATYLILKNQVLGAPVLSSSHGPRQMFETLWARAFRRICRS